MRTVQALTSATLPAARALLERHLETSLALLDNLAAFGHTLTEHPSSGTFKVVLDQGEVAAVFVLTRRGHLLAQTDRRDDYTHVMLAASEAEGIPVSGVLGDWAIAEPLWQAHCAMHPHFETTFRSREVLYKLPLECFTDTTPTGVRLLATTDFDAWIECHDHFLAEAGLPPGLPREQRQQAFEEKTARGHWWGRFVDGELASMATLGLGTPGVGQVGGVYTPPAFRRQGFSKAVMRQLLQDAKAVHGLHSIVLFTGETNLRAQPMYEGLGFTPIGHYGLFFGKTH